MKTPFIFRWINTLPDGPDEPQHSLLNEKHRNSTVSLF